MIPTDHREGKLSMSPLITQIVQHYRFMDGTPDGYNWALPILTTNVSKATIIWGLNNRFWNTIDTK